MTRALEVQQTLLEPGDAALCETLDHLGALARGRGDLDGAERWWQRELAELAPTARRLSAVADVFTIQPRP